LAGLPYVISGLVAAGGLAAALSTADGLLLTIGNAFIHDMRAGQSRDPAAKQQSQEERVILSKFALLAVAMVAALVASWKPAEILALVSASFSLAASAFFPGMVMGIFLGQSQPQRGHMGHVVGSGCHHFVHDAECAHLQSNILRTLPRRFGLRHSADFSWNLGCSHWVFDLMAVQPHLA
jgi:cation/acetate symporter